MTYVPGTSGNDLDLTGYENSSDLIYGFGGHDFLYGLSGNDFLNGGAGNDYLRGGTGNDTYEIGGSGSGGAGGLTGGWDKFIETDGSGDDRILIQDTAGWAWTAIQIDGIGLAGINSVEIIENNSSGPGYVYVRGTVDFQHVTQWIGSFSGIYGTANADTINGSDVADPIIQAGGGNDVVDGRNGNDTIYGENGNDALSGGAGNDVLNGGADNNTLTGGAGEDTFAVSTAGDLSTITDFIRGTDHIQFALSIADDYSDLTITDVSGNAHVAVGTVELTLTGIDHTLLNASDFLFV